jgi:hypothetical protein
MHRLVAHVQTARNGGYVLNLDPAVKSLPCTANKDIRNTVNYKNVMEYPMAVILTYLKPVCHQV